MRVILVFLLVFYPTVISWKTPKTKSCDTAKDPVQCEAQMQSFEAEYAQGLGRTLAISKRQAEITGLHRTLWRVEDCTVNPSLHEWVFAPWKGANSTSLLTATSKPLLMTWCGSGRHGFRFVVVQRYREGWKQVKSSDVVERLSPYRVPASVAGLGFSDPRVFADTSCKNQTSLRLVYCVKGKQNLAFQPSVELVSYNEAVDSLHLGRIGTLLDINATTSGLGEKNWSPFTYRGNTYYVYSIAPDHKIVSSYNQPLCEGEERQTMQFIHSTPFPSNFSWQWGHLRGGTPAVLVDGVVGPRYLSVFHSSTRYHHKAVRSYFMGAYLFSSEPPFGITHITPEPLVPRNLGHFYNKTELGWAYGGLDFVVFPVGLVLLDNETLALSVGINDNRCYLLELGLRPLIQSMIQTNNK